MDKISVIIPVYNREKYIGKCLDSVLDQSYSCIEIICVDDGSTDSSLTVCRAYSKKDNRIKVIPLAQNGGVSNARNTGIRNSSGKWIVFVDSDDHIEKEMLSDMIDVANMSSADIVLSDLEMYSGNQYQDMRISLEPDRLYNKEEIQKDILPRFTYEGSDNLGLFAFSTKLYKKRIITENNIQFDTSIAYEEDKLFVIEVLANCESLFYIPKAYYKYDTSSGGLYSSFNPKAWKWYVNSYQRINQLIDRYQIMNTNSSYNCNSFIYNITWFLYRSQRIEDKRVRKLLQDQVVNDNDVQSICTEIVNTLTSFDRRMAKAILSKNRWKAIKLIDFVYSGKKERIVKLLKR